MSNFQLNLEESEVKILLESLIEKEQHMAKVCDTIAQNQPTTKPPITAALCEGNTMRYIIFIALLMISAHSYSIEIKNFKSGLMCGINKKDMGWVCFEKDEILISGQSSCVSMGEEFKCTWYGYSFDYTNAKKGQEIECKYTYSEAIATQDLNSRSNEKKKVQYFTFSLEKEKGYFVNPQYSPLRLSSNHKVNKLTQDVACVSEGEKLYEYRFITVYPPRT